MEKAKEYLPKADLPGRVQHTKVRILDGQRTDVFAMQALNYMAPLRIVVVDDEPGLLEVCQHLLRESFKDATVLPFPNGKEAWPELLHADPDLLITDNLMPYMTGIDLLERLVERKATYPIIVISGFSYTARDVEQFASQGLNVAFLAKPFTSEQLRGLLSSMVPNTLALVKTELPAKPVFCVLVGNSHIEKALKYLLFYALDWRYQLKFIQFSRATELLRLAEENSFDLIVLYAGNVVWDTGSCARWLDPGWPSLVADVLGGLKSQYGKPVFVTQGGDLSEELKPVGVTFLKSPAKGEEFCDALQLPNPRQFPERLPKREFWVGICGISPGDDFERRHIVRPIQDELGEEYSIVLDCFIHGEAMLDSSVPDFRDPFDLIFVFLDPTIQPSDALYKGGDLKLVTDLKSKFQKPIILLTDECAYGHDSADEFKQAGADAFFRLPIDPNHFTESLCSILRKPVFSVAICGESAGNNLDRFLAKPFTREDFQGLLANMVAHPLPLAKKEQPNPHAARPLRVVLLDDNEDFLLLHEGIIQVLYEQATVLKFRGSEEAWEELLRTDPDLLMMDINHPGMDGFAMLRLLAERKVNYPILIVSGSLPGTEERARVCAGPNLNVAFVQKPWELRELCPELAIHLGPSDVAEDYFKKAKSGLVADPLGLEQPPKPVFVVAMCGTAAGREDLQFFRNAIQQELSDKWAVDYNHFLYTDDLLVQARHRSFDFFFFILNPVLYPSDAENEFTDVHELVTNLKSEFQKPIVIVSTGSAYGLGCEPGFIQVGADGFCGRRSDDLEKIQAILSSIFKEPKAVEVTAPTSSVRFDEPVNGKGDPEIWFQMGDCYYLGDHVPKDYAQAAKLYRKAAEHGHPGAQLNLGKCYSTGRGVPQNYTEAAEWFCRAADQRRGGEDLASRLQYEKCEVGWQNSAGDTRMTYAEFAKWVRRSAEFQLGICYEKGHGVQEDHTEAVKWYRKAAEQDFGPAQRNLGYCYQTGRGVPQDYSQAVSWYRKARQNWDFQADRDLGYCYEFGLGVHPNMGAAVMWYKTAAWSGHSNDQHRLAMCYAEGRGVRRDLNLAYRWFKLAAEQGHKEAEQELASLSSITPPEQLKEWQSDYRHFKFGAS